MITDACLETVNLCGKANTHPALCTRRIIGVDGLLFLLLWGNGYIGSKIGLRLSGTFSFLVFLFVIAVLLVMIAILLEDFGLFGCFQPFHFLLILAVFLQG